MKKRLFTCLFNVLFSVCLLLISWPAVIIAASVDQSAEPLIYGQKSGRFSPALIQSDKLESAVAVKGKLSDKCKNGPLYNNTYQSYF
jgi:hypothetical protein